MKFVVHHSQWWCTYLKISILFFICREVAKYIFPNLFWKWACHFVFNILVRFPINDIKIFIYVMHVDLIYSRLKVQARESCCLIPVCIETYPFFIVLCRYCRVFFFFKQIEGCGNHVWSSLVSQFFLNSICSLWVFYITFC